MNLLLFILICYGMTQIIVFGKIFESLRNKMNLHVFKCAMCCSFWVGLLVFFIFWFCNIHLFPYLYIGSFLFGCISSATSFALTSIIGEKGININID